MVIFKLLERYNAPIFPVIVFNYGTCLVFGFFLLPAPEKFHLVATENWFPFALFIGMMFILLFNLIGTSAQKNGISVTAVAQKMSLAIPVVAAYFIHHEQSINIYKGIGIVLAIAAVVLSSIRKEEIEKQSDNSNKGLILLISLIIFLGSGLVDTVIDYTQSNYLDDTSQNTFLTTLFGTAFLLGFLKLLFDLVFKGLKFRFKRVVLWGLILGLPNYGSIYFLIKALKYANFESSALFPLNNVGIVMASTLAAMFLFNEKLSKLNILGVLLSIAAIALISFGE
ncbi:MAG: hypothetical protein WD048_03210 [Chitinophagales bacterium]